MLISSRETPSGFTVASEMTQGAVRGNAGEGRNNPQIRPDCDAGSHSSVPRNRAGHTSAEYHAKEVSAIAPASATKGCIE